MKEQITIGKVAAIAYSYEPVNSNTRIIAVIGAPITELDTAAIPETESTDNNKPYQSIEIPWCNFVAKSFADLFS